MGKVQLLKKIGKVTANVLLYVFIAVCVLGIFMTVSSKKSGDDATTLFGMQMRLVLTESMEKCEETDVSGYDIKDIPKDSMVFVDIVPEDPDEAAEWYADLKIGDVLTFKYVYVKQVTITHRITGIRANGDGGYTIRLEGDNKNSDSETLVQEINTSKKNSPNYVIGKVTGQSKLLGSVVSAMKSPIGMILIVILPSLIIVVMELFKIANMFTADKKKKEREELERKQNELDELKRRLAELESLKAQSAQPPVDESSPSTGEDSQG